MLESGEEAEGTEGMMVAGWKEKFWMGVLVVSGGLMIGLIEVGAGCVNFMSNPPKLPKSIEKAGVSCFWMGLLPK